MIAHAPDSGTVAVESPAQPARRPRPLRSRVVSPRIVLTSSLLNREGDPALDGREIRKLSVASVGAGKRAIVMEILEDYTGDPDSYWLSIEGREAPLFSMFGDHLSVAEINFITDQLSALRSRARGVGILPTPAGWSITAGRYEDCAEPDWPAGKAPRFVQVEDTAAAVTAIVADAPWYSRRPTECDLSVSFGGDDSLYATVPFAVVDQLIAALTEARHRAVAAGILPEGGAR